MIFFGYCFSWIYATIGLLTKDPETAQVAGILPFFILVFASSAIVPVATMPSWLQPFARHQPVSITINAVRALLQGEPTHQLGVAIAGVVDGDPRGLLHDRGAPLPQRHRLSGLRNRVRRQPRTPGHGGRLIEAEQREHRGRDIGQGALGGERAVAAGEDHRYGVGRVGGAGRAVRG